MKPSLEEVMLKILELTTKKGKKETFINIRNITEELNTHKEDLMPSLLQLVRDQVIRFDSAKRNAIRLLMVEKAA